MVTLERAGKRRVEAASPPLPPAPNPAHSSGTRAPESLGGTDGRRRRASQSDGVGAAPISVWTLLAEERAKVARLRRAVLTQRRRAETWRHRALRGKKR